MGDKFPGWSARNPLGIIALFISLIYGMSALLLGTSVDSLATSNQTILVCFVVSFPFVVLVVFAWFVAKHHKKLYGPADFRSDEAFHAVQDLPPADLARRLSQEIEKDEEEPGAGPIANRWLSRTTWSSQKDRFTRAFVAEALVFQELQREFGGAVRRQVAVPLRDGRRFRADGVLQVGDKTIIVEVKVARSPSSVRNMIINTIKLLESYEGSLEKRETKSAKFVLAIVADGFAPPNEMYKDIEKYQRMFEGIIQIRLLLLQDLMLKYGLPLAGENDDDAPAADHNG